MNGAMARRAAALALLTLVLDPPITDGPRFVAWVAGVLAVVAAAPRSWRRLGIAAAVCLLALAGRHSLPSLHIEEAHNYFVPELAPPVRQWLPPAVLSAVDTQFRERYPPEYWCEPGVGGCWRASGPVTQPLAFSADAVFRRRRYSRVVRTIDFRGLGELRAGFTNRVETNWWDRTSDVRRRDMPFYVMYVLPREAAGSDLCWRGDMFWEQPTGFEDVGAATPTCRTIQASDAGRRVFGISLLHQPLSMRLEPTPALSRAATAAQALALIGAAAVVVVALWPLPKRLLLALAVAAVGAVAIGPEALSSFARYDPIGGGSDGIAYESFAHTILERAESGDLAGALKGVEPSFFFMPGLRYFRALEKTVFGETYLGYLAVLLLMPGVLLGFLRVFLPAGLALVLWVTFFLPVPTAERFSWSFDGYVDLARGGLAEPLAHVLWIGGAALAVSAVAERPGRSSHVPWGSFVLSLACFVRPNLLISTGLVLLFVSFRLYRLGRSRELGPLWLAFTPFLWVPLHNLIYAGRFELASRVIGPATLTPPAVYVEALREVLTGQVHAEASQRVATQVVSWIGSPLRAAVLAASLLGLALRGAPVPNRALALGVIGLHPLLLLWSPHGRYSQLAWQLTLTSAIANLAFVTSLLLARGRHMLPARVAAAARRALSWHTARKVLGVAAAVVVALELAFRVGDVRHPEDVQPPDGRSYFVLHRDLLGFRGKDRAGAGQGCVILVTAGGSTTESPRLSHDESWPGRLELELSRTLTCVGVSNAGRAGFATFGVRRLLDQLVLERRPDVVLLLPGLEDIAREHASLAETRPLWPARLRHVLASHSALASALLSPDGQRVSAAHGDMRERIASLPNAAVDRRRSQELLVRHRQTYVPGYGSRLEEIVLLARARGVELVLVTQPALYGHEIDPATQADLQWLQVDPETGMHGALAWRLLEEYNDATRKVGREHGVQVIDLARQLPKDSRLYADFVHFSREGAARAAEIVARGLCPTFQRRFPQLVNRNCPAAER